jgi:hypothetical protein
MYHEEWVEAGDMTLSCKKLEAVLKQAGVADARTALFTWGRRLAAGFRIYNLHFVTQGKDDTFNTVDQSMRTLR